MKRRYSVTLTEETVAEYQAFAKSIGLRSGVMSELCDDAIRNTTIVMKEFVARHQVKGSLSISDFFSVMGEHVGMHFKNIEKEEEHVEEQKRAAAPGEKRA